MPVQIKIETNYNKDNLDAIVNLFLTIGKLNYDKRLLLLFILMEKLLQTLHGQKNLTPIILKKL